MNFFLSPSSACLPYLRTVFHFSQSHTLKFTNLDTVHLLRLLHHNFTAIWVCLIQTALTCVFSFFGIFQPSSIKFGLLHSSFAVFTFFFKNDTNMVFSLSFANCCSHLCSFRLEAFEIDIYSPPPEN